MTAREDAIEAVKDVARRKWAPRMTGLVTWEAAAVRPGREVGEVKPRLLDLFCGAGGASWGYSLAGFDVVGVDWVAQPEYPFEFIRADALTFPLDGFDYIHASPPCKAFTPLRHTRRDGLFDVHDDLLTPTRERLKVTGATWVIENVPGAPMRDAVTYCGSSFGLQVRRHRLFESSIPLFPPPCDHANQPEVLGVYGNGGAWDRTANPGGGGRKVVGADAAAALGITHTTRQQGLSQAIPPAYTEHIGRQLLVRG